jgi:hypothetical protein
MNSSDIKVSVIMPVYNSGNYLKRAVDSILNQSLKEFELILVDDGSTDGSSERCDEYAQKDNRVIVIHQTNRGICNARNTALKIAQGEYISFSDHDDEYLQGLLKKAYTTAIKQNADIVKFCKKEFIYKKDCLIRIKTEILQNRILKRDEISECIFCLKDSGVLNCVWDGLFRRSLFDNIQFDIDYKSGGEDIAFMYDIIGNVNRLVLLNNIYYYHYIRKGFSTSTKFNLQNIQSKIKLAQLFNKVLEKFSIDYNVKSLDYVYYLMKFVYCPIIAILADSGCPYTQKEKVKVLSGLLNKDFTPNYFLLQHTLAIYRRSNKIGVAYFLLKHSCYNILFFMFNLRLKCS